MATKDQAQIVFGKPPIFNRNSDPKGRSLIKLMYEQPSIMSIIPGRINFQSTTEFLKQSSAITGINITEDNDLTNRQQFSQLYDNNKGEFSVASAVNEKIIQLRTDKQGLANLTKTADELKNGSARYFDFIPALSDYNGIVSTLYGRVAAALDIKLEFTPRLLEVELFSRLNYWIENSSSISESMNTEVGPTVLNGLTGMVNSFAREAKFLLKEEDLAKNAAGTEATGAISTAFETVSKFVSGDASAGIRASLGDAVLGLNPMFPEVWKNSTFDRGYSINFKFTSPYSDKNSIMRDVIFPFLTLVSMVAPIQRSPTAYSEPFVFQIDCPGRFACDLGICTSFSFSRGGSEKLYTKNGLPRVIEVTMQVKDLYPTLMLSKNYKALYTNPSLAVFLDNMAGLSITQSGAGTSIFNLIEQRVDATAYSIANLDATIINGITSSLLEKPATASIINIFRG